MHYNTICRELKNYLILVNILDTLCRLAVKKPQNLTHINPPCTIFLDRTIQEVPVLPLHGSEAFGNFKVQCLPD